MKKRFVFDDVNIVLQLPALSDLQSESNNKGFVIPELILCNGALAMSSGQNSKYTSCVCGCNTLCEDASICMVGVYTSVV